MIVADYLKHRWASSGYVAKAAYAITAIPLAIWIASTVESTLLCGLRALSSCASFNAKTRSDRRALARYHFWDSVATGTLFFVSFIPLYGTYKSYKFIFQMAANHVSNKRLLRQLQQKQNAQKADQLYHELLDWEPDVEQLIQFATKTPPPTQTELDQTSQQLRGSLLGRSWVYGISFHLIKNGYRAAEICTTRIARYVRLVFAGHLLRLFLQTGKIVVKAVIQEAVYARDLADQPRRIHVPKKAIRELCRDDIFLMLETCPSQQERTRFRETWALVSKLYRQYAVENDLARPDLDSALPEGAPVDYFHKRGFLPRACGCPKAKTADYILKEDYFKPIFPFIDHFDMNWLKTMPAVEKQKLMLGLSTQLPTLQTLNLDMAGIDPRWQLLIAVQFANHAPSLRQVTFTHADPRATNLMRRFSSWRCTVENR